MAFVKDLKSAYIIPLSPSGLTQSSMVLIHKGRRLSVKLAFFQIYKLSSWLNT
jgi:hypothetical protein